MDLVVHSFTMTQGSVSEPILVVIVHNDVSVPRVNVHSMLQWNRSYVETIIIHFNKKLHQVINYIIPYNGLIEVARMIGGNDNSLNV